MSCNMARVLLVGLLALLLAACARDTEDLEAFVAEVRARPAPPLEPLPALQTFEAHEYTAYTLRDPFSAPRAAGGATGPRPDPERRKESLEAFPLDALRMVGTIGAGADLMALILAPDRVTHRIRVGNYLGQSEGRVVQVRPDRVELVELLSDGAGGWLEREATVALQDE